MLVATYRNALWHMPTPARSLRSVIKQTIIEVFVAAVGITRAIRSLSQAIIINMAPKANRHLGDKNEGVKTVRSGRGKGEPLGSNKRLASTTGKAAGENASILGQMIDAKMSTKASDSTTPLLEDKVKEESDLGSADCSFSETDESEISETGNKSASGECTVRKARQRKSVKSRSGLQEGSESMASRNGRSLRWDYTGINLADTSTGGNQSSAKDKNGSDPGPAAGEIGTTGRNYEIGTDVGILQSIYSSIKELQTETRIDSHRARVATKRLQGSVRKVAKSCKEIEAKLCSMEDRIVAVEDDMDTLKEQNATRDGQLTDVMWKLEDLENRQRRNNLRFLGIPEGLEGDNMQTYMVTLLRGSFPELGNRDWDNEVQRAHRFPLNTQERSWYI
ncbi:hypothetical protein NDU88_002562 [Pleurodeles waltl]|uniref:Uncharacterized protein n=1 Tax=Pleurodeles waltl TaxID=8319 RepID=A0AAV7T2G4_PLEWA|nr:hypothetical protein NDU88_002562 [Pleurodeles waltl]